MLLAHIFKRLRYGPSYLLRRFFIMLLRRATVVVTALVLSILVYQH